MAAQTITTSFSTGAILPLINVDISGNYAAIVQASGAGTGNVIGPTGSTTGNIASYANTTGQLLFNSQASIVGSILTAPTIDATTALIIPTTPPASSTAVGTAGQIIVGTDKFLYLCPSTNVWVRISGLSF